MQMKRFVSLLLCALLCFAFPQHTSAARSAECSAAAFVLYCPDNGKILFSRDEHKHLRPASTTKLMTTLLTLEQAAKGDKTVTFVKSMEAEGSSMYLKFGEKLRLSDLATGMMMCSGNDAANAAALSISGSFEKFSGLMNSRAREIGMKDTHFVTPSGLDDDEHYSSALDLALLMAEGLKNRAFSVLTAKKSEAVSFISPNDKHITYQNHNRLLSMYPDCIGGKTGYTTAAGRCLVSAAERDGITLVCVTLNDRSDWNDHISLYDSGFELLEKKTFNDSAFSAEVACVGGESGSARVTGESDISFTVESGSGKRIKRNIFLENFLYAPVKKGKAVGKIVYFLDGERIGEVRLLADSDVKAPAVKSIIDRIKELFNNGK